MPTAGEIPQSPMSGKTSMAMDSILKESATLNTARLAVAEARTPVPLPSFGRFTKKPVTIEAMRYTLENMPAIRVWFNANKVPFVTYPDRTLDQVLIRIPTLEGDMEVRPGDWIIRGIKGEFYPCRADIFEATYSLPAPAEPQRPELTKDQIAEIIANKTLRKNLDDQLQTLRGLPASRERAHSITKLQEAIMWLGMDLKRLNDTRPYPSSYDATSTKIEPTADGLKL